VIINQHEISDMVVSTFKPYWWPNPHESKKEIIFFEPPATMSSSELN